MESEPRLDLALVRSQQETQPGFYWLTLELPRDYPQVLPGQYLNLRPTQGLEFTFRRPFGVVECRREPSATVVELFYAVIGRGTKAMSAWRAGDKVDCLGPLGKPYVIDSSKPALLVAGGRGAAPLLYLNRLLKDAGHHPIRFAFGVRSESLLFGLDRLDADHLFVASDDGSTGFSGNIVSGLEQARPQWLADDPVLYVCGPEALLASTAGLSQRHGLSCQVSLEGVYGCGLGLCRGCAVPLKNDPGYLMQCIEGPVVDASLVDWERMHV